jgi:hypothetical protein
MSFIVEDLDFRPGNEGFSPKACYHQSMDFLIYLNEDCSYRADRVDKFLTLLWHPNEERLVGIKLKSFLALFNAANVFLGSSTESPIPLAQVLKLLECSVEMWLEDGGLDKLERDRLRARYEKAIQLSVNEKVVAKPVAA